MVEWALDPTFREARRVEGPVTGPERDFTAKLDLAELPSGQLVHYRVLFRDLDDASIVSAPVAGRLRTAPTVARDVTFIWSGDTAGQGYGISTDFGGMRMYDVMRRARPDFFIHCGDQIYADDPIVPKLVPKRGPVWRNLTTDAKSKVAETLADFRGNFAYNLLDENVRRFNAEVPSLVQWDDHEIANNWYPGRRLRRQLYVDNDATTLSERARQAMFEYTPIRGEPDEPRRIYRSVSYGPSIDLFLLDERSYRGKNTDGLEEEQSASSTMLGKRQLAWFKRALAASKATWKVIATDCPLGLMVSDRGPRGQRTQDGWSNGNGEPHGRELELADLLSFVKRKAIKNLVWLTADVHYAAAYRFDPRRAVFQDFKPFWQFVAGPIHAATFGPNKLDDTFGPEKKFERAPKHVGFGVSPTAGMQFFGAVHVDAKSERMTVSLHDLSGARIYGVELDPER
jgi:alkaline phosphatase D